MKINYLKIAVIYLVIGLVFIINSKIYAASIGMSVNKSSVTVGDTFSVTISGINGRVNISGNDKVTISPSGSQFVDGSLTISGTAKGVGTGVVTVTPVDVTTTNADPVEITKAETRSIIIKEKETEKKEETKTTQENKKTNTTTKKKKETKKTDISKNTTNKEKKEEPEVVVNEEDQGTIAELGIEDMNIFTVKQNGEKNEVTLNPKFESNVFEYTLNVESDIEKIEIDSKYNSNYELKIEGLEENLKTGENIVKITLTRENESKVYTIKVLKEEIKENLEPEAKKEKNQKLIIFTVPQFIGILLLIVIFENIIIYGIYKIKKEKN